MSTSAASRGTNRTMITIATALMLFSMFFGAGNLIFPPQLGLKAGDNFWPAILGFLGAGVVLPVLAIVAIALSGTSVRDLARRSGWLFGLIFPILAYLSIGAFYALPRTGAVSFETVVTPLTGLDSLGASAIFNLIFFGVSLALAWFPNAIVSTLGKVLTPMLVILLIVLITIAVTSYDTISRAPVEPYDQLPAAAGLLEGYLTMDAIAGLAFGIVVISSLRGHGVREGKPLLKATVTSGVIAGVLLAAIYVGLGIIGRVLPGAENLESGASILTEASNATMGQAGQFVFSAIVVLACLTTSVGLISATSEFFASIMPGIKYHVWVVAFTVLSTVLATMGLDTVLAIAAPVIGFIYPPAITLIALALIDSALRNKVHLNWTFRLAIWVAVIWSALTTLVDLGVSALAPLVSWAPLQAQSLGWVLPVLVAAVIGVILDIRSGAQTPATAE